MRSRLIFFALGFVTGVAASILVVAYRYNSQAAWNPNAITGTTRWAGQPADGSIVLADLALKNNTRSDYKVTRTDHMNVMLRTSRGLYRVEGATLDTPIFIPAREVGNYQLRLPSIPLFAIAFNEREPAQNKSLIESAIPQQIRAIEIFDDAHRYKITIPNKQ